MLHWIRIVVGCFFLFCFSLQGHAAEQGNGAERTVDSARFPAKIRIALDAEPVSLDPHEQLSEGGLQYSHLVFDPLVRWRQDGSIEPRLATRWQWMDATTLRIFLRHGVVFQTGHPMRAQDVVFTIQRLKKSTDFKALFAVIHSVSTVDDYTVDIHTDHPFPLLLNVLAYVFIIDKTFYQGHDEVIKFGRSFASTHVSGTGPYRLVKRIQGEKLIFKRNPDYWDKASPGNVGTIEIIPIASDSTRLAALLTGDVDVISPVAAVDVARVKRMPGLQLVTFPGTRIIMLQLNQKRRPEFRDVRVRQAMSLAINQQLIVEKILRGLGQAAGQLSAAPFAGHVDSLVPHYDLTKAKQLMKAAGYAQGFRVTLMAPNNRYMNDEQIAQAVAAMLKKINIQVDFKTLPKAQYFQLYDQQAADIMMLGWQSDTLDSNNIYEFTVACRDAKTGLGTYNASGYCNPALDAEIQAANQEFNREDRTMMLQNIEQIVARDVPVVPLHWQMVLWAVRKGIALGPVLNAQNYPYLGDLVVHEMRHAQPDGSAGGSN